MSPQASVTYVFYATCFVWPACFCDMRGLWSVSFMWCILAFPIAMLCVRCMCSAVILCSQVCPVCHISRAKTLPTSCDVCVFMWRAVMFRIIALDDDQRFARWPVTVDIKVNAILYFHLSLCLICQLFGVNFSFYFYFCLYYILRFLSHSTFLLNHTYMQIYESFSFPSDLCLNHVLKFLSHSAFFLNHCMWYL